MASGKNIDDMIDLLQRQVDLSEAANNTRQAILADVGGASEPIFSHPVSPVPSSIPSSPDNPSPGRTPDPVFLLMLRYLEELVRMQGAAVKAEQSTRDILMNPEFKESTTRMGRWWKRMKTWSPMRDRMVLESAKTGMQVGQAAGRVFGKSKAGRGVGKAVGIAAGNIAAVGVAFKAVRDAVDHFTTAALENARRLSEVSGPMAAITAERDLHQLLRDIRIGQGTATSTRDLMRSESSRKDAEANIEIALTNIGNRVLVALNNTMTPILETIARGLERIDKAVDWLRTKFGGADEPVGRVGLGAEAARMHALAADAERRAGNLLAAAKAAELLLGGRVVRPPG